MNKKLQIILIASLFAISTAQPVHALNLRSLATIIASKTAPLLKSAKALVRNPNFQASAVSAALLGVLYLLARQVRFSYHMRTTLSSRTGIQRVNVNNQHGKVYVQAVHGGVVRRITGSTENEGPSAVTRGTMEEGADIVGMADGNVEFDNQVNDGVLSIRTTAPQRSGWQRFWDRFFCNRPSGHFFIRISDNIPVTIQAKNNSTRNNQLLELVGLGGFNFFLPELRNHGLDRGSSHAVVIDGSGQELRGSIDVTVAPGDTIAVQNSTEATNGIYRTGRFQQDGQFHHE